MLILLYQFSIRSLHEPVRMMFSDEEGSMLATDEYFVSDNLEANNSPVNRMVTICNEEEGTEYEVVTSEMEDERD